MKFTNGLYYFITPRMNNVTMKKLYKADLMNNLTLQVRVILVWLEQVTWSMRGKQLAVTTHNSQFLLGHVMLLLGHMMLLLGHTK